LREHLRRLLGLLAEEPEHQGHQRDAAGPEHRARPGDLRQDHARDPGAGVEARPMTAWSEYLVSHGSSGAVGRFAAAAALAWRRGGGVGAEGRRGAELGVLRCRPTPRHARLRPDPAVGRLVRRAPEADEAEVRRLRALADRLFEEGRRLAAEAGLPFEILDV